eukprot:gene21387-biopygen19179
MRPQAALGTISEGMRHRMSLSAEAEVRTNAERWTKARVNNCSNGTRGSELRAAPATGQRAEPPRRPMRLRRSPRSRGTRRRSRVPPPWRRPAGTRWAPRRGRRPERRDRARALLRAESALGAAECRFALHNSGPPPLGRRRHRSCRPGRVPRAPDVSQTRPGRVLSRLSQHAGSAGSPCPTGGRQRSGVAAKVVLSCSAGVSTGSPLYRV